MKQAEKVFYALGTLNKITAYGERAPEGVERAAARVFEIDAKMSAFREDSEITRISRSAGSGAVTVSAETFSLLRRAKDISKASGGAFDITLRPLTSLWEAGRAANRIPGDSEIAACKELVGCRDLLFEEKARAVGLRRRGQSIDLGGIAKGYAADEAAAALRESGIRHAMINLGGNLAAVGTRPDGSPWRVGIQHPAARRGEYFAALETSGGAVVTSGGYEQFFIQNGVRCHHILDPQTGRPAQSTVAGVTVVCGSSADADGLTTALFVLGPHRSSDLLARYGAEAVFVCESGGAGNDFQVYATAGLSRRLHMSNISAYGSPEGREEKQ